ncbi:MAG: FAD-dependent oxidoreductase [Thermodesulfobacteriota bacterium]
MFRHLFSPLTIRNMEIKNRVVMPPMAPGMFDREFVTERATNYYRARAEGGVGMIITGASTYAPPPRAHSTAALWDSGMWNDKFISGWQELVSEIHKYDTRIGMQLNHVGRQISDRLYGEQPISSSALPCPVYKSVPHSLSIPEIEGMIEYFVEASRRCKDAGFDFVEIHGAHGYLGTQFLSPYMNKRSDEYGGNAEGRARFLCEIIRRIKKRLGEDFVIGARINGRDNIEGGATIDDMKEVCPFLQNAGADYLHVSATVYGGHPSIAPMTEPSGCFVSLAEEVKQVVDIPVIAVGKIDTPQLAEEIIAEKKADLAAVGRALIADPEWVNKASKGRPEEIRKCIYCNQGCLDRVTYVGLDGNLTPITCLLNPEVGREEEFRLVPARKRKRVLVVGGGPGGLESARVAAERGHDVTLLEKEDRLGGQLLLACGTPSKLRYKEAIDFLVRQVEESGVNVLLNHEATVESVVRMQPVAVIVATGAVPLIPEIEGVEKKRVVTHDKVLSGRYDPGRRVLIVGGGATGLDTADFLISLGRQVRLIEMTKRLGSKMGRVARFDMLRRLKANNVEMITSCRITRISDDEVEAFINDRRTIFNNFDSVILAAGARSNNPLTEELRKRFADVYVIGDAAEPREAIDAIHEGAMAGRKV